MKLLSYLKALYVLMLFLILPTLSSAAVNFEQNALTNSDLAPSHFISSERWQEDKGQDIRKQPGKDKKGQPQEKGKTVKEVPKAKPKLPPANVDEKEEAKPPAGKGKK